MIAGYILNMIFGSPKGFANIEKLVSSFAQKIEKTLRKYYEDSPEAQRMSGGVLVFFTVVIFAVIPLALIILGYKLYPVAGFIFDCFFCWAAFSIRDVRDDLNRLFRTVRSGNTMRTEKTLKKLTGNDYEELTQDFAIKKSVECAADYTADNGVGTLFFMAIAGGFGGLFYRCISILNKRFSVLNIDYLDFGKPARDLWNVLNFIPAKICAFILKLNVKFLSLDAKNCKKIYNRDRKKHTRKNLAPCRAIMAGALGIELTDETYKENELFKTRAIGEQIKDCQPNDIYWSAQLLSGTVFSSLVLFSLIRAVFIFFF